MWTNFSSEEKNKYLETSLYHMVGMIQTHHFIYFDLNQTKQ